MAHSGPISPEPWPGKRLALFPEGGLKRTGVFSCSIEHDGKPKQAIGLKIGKWALTDRSMVIIQLLSNLAN